MSANKSIIFLCHVSGTSLTLDKRHHHSFEPLQKQTAPTIIKSKQDHLRSVSSLISRWRHRTLSGRTLDATAAGTGNGAVVGCSMEGELTKVVRQCYVLYSCLDPQVVYGRQAERRSNGQTRPAAAAAAGQQRQSKHVNDGRGAFALDLGGFKRFIEEARICGGGNRGGGDAESG